MTPWHCASLYNICTSWRLKIVIYMTTTIKWSIVFVCMSHTYMNSSWKYCEIKIVNSLRDREESISIYRSSRFQALQKSKNKHDSQIWCFRAHYKKTLYFQVLTINNIICIYFKYLNALRIQYNIIIRKHSITYRPVRNILNCCVFYCIAPYLTFIVKLQETLSCRSKVSKHEFGSLEDVFEVGM